MRRMKNPKYFIGLIVLLVICAIAWYLFSENFPFQEQASSYVLNEEAHPKIDSLLNRAEEKRKSRDYKTAVGLASEALEQSQQQRYCSGEVKAMWIIGYVYGHQAKFDSAIAVHEKARELVKKYRLDPALYHQAGIVLALDYFDSGQNQKAMQCEKEALDYFLKSDDVYHISMAYNNLGLIYKRLGMYQKAEQAFKKGIPYADQIPKDRYYERSFIGNLGILYAITGQLKKAIPMIERSLQMGKEMNDPVSQGIDHRYLGSIYFARGNFREAIRHYLADAQLTEIAGENHGMIRAYRNVARVYDALNDCEHAMLYYQKAENIVDTKLSGKSQHFPQAYRSFGVHWILRQNYKKAEEYLLKALEGYQALNMPADIGLCYLDLADLHFHQEDYEGCLVSARSALKISREIKSGDYDLTAAWLRIGSANAGLGRQDSAIAYLKKAAALAENLDDSQVAWQAHYYLAGCYRQLGDLNSSAEHSRKAIAAIEKLRRYSISPELGSSFLADKSDVYNQYFDVLFDIYQAQPSTDALDKLFALVQQTRSRALLENLKTGVQSVFSQSKESITLQDIEEQMVALNQMIREESLKPKEERKKEMISLWQNQVAALQREYKLRATQFAASNPELSTLLGFMDPLPIQKLQDALKPNQIVLSYYITSDDVYAFIVSRTTREVKKLSISPESLRQHIHKLRQPFQDFRNGKIDFLRLPFDFQFSQSLYRELIAPLLASIESGENLIIVPAGVLNYLPFEMLVSGQNAIDRSDVLFGEYKQCRFMIEDFTISYLPSSAMIPLLMREKPNEADETLLAFGDPIASKEINEMPQLAVNAPPSGLRLMALTPLPGASLEVKGILDIFSHKGATPDASALIGTEASESIYKENANRYRYIHFATHGYVDEQNPNFSALLLSPGRETEDGFLYTHEIYTYPIHAELVSLSACETALGKLQQGEGLVSFVQAFFAAGSQNVMASLWSVDESTYPLMVSFYKFLRKGFGEAEALRRAKLEFMRKNSPFENGAKYANCHPFLWAPFVLYGVD